MLKAIRSRSKSCPGRTAGSKVQAVGILAALLAGLVGLAWTSPEQLDRLPHLCVWSLLLGRPCPGCGTTHALCCLVHGEFARAVAYNWNVVVLAPVLVWIGVEQFRILRR